MLNTPLNRRGIGLVFVMLLVEQQIRKADAVMTSTVAAEVALYSTPHFSDQSELRKIRPPTCW
jgi:hypothetical protein